MRRTPPNWPTLFDLRDGGPYQGTEHAGLTAPQRVLADRMLDTWTGFARTGTVSWPVYPDVLSLAPQAIHPVDAWTEHHCDLWAGEG